MGLSKAVKCRASNNIIDESSNFIDHNLQIIRTVLFTSFFGTVFWIGKRACLAKTFRCVSDIPDIYFSKRVFLRGRVSKISDNGLVHVQHIPALNLPKWMASSNPESCISVKLIGLQFPQSQMSQAIEHLSKHRNEIVWIKPFSRDVRKNDTAGKSMAGYIHGLVLSNKVLYGKCINYNLLRLGLAQVQQLPADVFDSKLTTRLFKQQRRAIYWKRGMWKVTSQ